MRAMMRSLVGQRISYIDLVANSATGAALSVPVTPQCYGAHIG